MNLSMRQTDTDLRTQRTRLVAKEKGYRGRDRVEVWD